MDLNDFLAERRAECNVQPSGEYFCEGCNVEFNGHNGECPECETSEAVVINFVAYY